MEEDQSINSGRSLERKTLMHSVYDILRQDIVNAKMAPGSRIHEAAIARDLGVSRGPVREALQKLAAEGFVELTPHRRAVVSSLTVQEFIDAYRVREVLEMLGARLAALQIDEENLEMLGKLHTQMETHAEKDEVEGFFAANEKFHRIIIVQSKNRKLIEIYSSLVDQLRRYRMRSLTLRGGLKRSCKEHQAIFDALRAGDAKKAAIVMSEHIQIPRQVLQSEYSDNELELVQREDE